MDGFDSPQDTLQQYFDDLLKDMARKPAPALPFPEHRARVARLLSTRPLPVKVQPVAEAPVAEKPVVAKPAVEAPEKPPALEPAAAEQLAEAPADAAIEGLTWLENGRPPWAQRQFDVLLFKVSGLMLAVPLVALGQIQPLTDQLTPIFGQADWFMGLLPTPAGKVRTVNTAKFVMPERYDERFLETAHYVISINGLPWGLAVDSVNQPIMLHPDDVKWRSERSKRPWLAGTVKEYMCALLDIPMMGKLLQEADVNTP